MYFMYSNSVSWCVKPPPCIAKTLIVSCYILHKKTLHCHHFHLVHFVCSLISACQNKEGEICPPVGCRRWLCASQILTTLPHYNKTTPKVTSALECDAWGTFCYHLFDNILGLLLASCTKTCFQSKSLSIWEEGWSYRLEPGGPAYPLF